MRRFATAALLGLALIGTAACSGCAVLNPNAAVLGETLKDEKALYAAEAAFYGANAAAEAAVDNKLITPGSPLAIQIADGLAKAKDALGAARAAYKIGDATTYVGKLAAVQGFVGDAWKLIPGKA